MIRRLAHPMRGLVAAVLIWVLLASIFAFGLGLPELLLISVVAVVGGIAAGSERRQVRLPRDAA
jgi:hypothetical protein